MASEDGSPAVPAEGGEVRQFQGVNDAGLGDCPDGFSPGNTVGTTGVAVPGCSVGDAFTHALGDPAEARLAAALGYVANKGCPASRSPMTR